MRILVSTRASRTPPRRGVSAGARCPRHGLHAPRALGNVPLPAPAHVSQVTAVLVMVDPPDTYPAAWSMSTG